MSPRRTLPAFAFLLLILPIGIAAQEEGIPDPSAYLEMKERFDAAMEGGDFAKAIELADEVNEVVWPVQWEAMYNTARAQDVRVSLLGCRLRILGHAHDDQ